MTHQRSRLGDIAGLGMIRYIDDMMEEGERLLERDRIERETRESEREQRTEMLNRAYVKKEDSNYTIRIENTFDQCSAYAPKEDYHQFGINEFYWQPICESTLRSMFRETPLKRHMLLNISLTEKKGYEPIKFKYDTKDYGGNVYFGKNLITCYGQGYGLLVNILKLKHNKPKTAWLKLSENTDIANRL